MASVDHVNVAIDDDCRTMRDMGQRAANRRLDSTGPDLADADDEMTAIDRIAMHRRAIGERGQPDLGDVPARQAILAQRADRIAVAQPGAGVAKVEMRVERDQPDLVERQVKRVDPGPGDRIVAADQQGQLVPRHARRAGIADRAGRLLDHQAVDVHIAMIGDPARQLASRLDVVAPDSLERRPEQRRRQVAAPGRDRSGGERSTDQPDRRANSLGAVGGDQQVGQIGPAHA